MKSGIYCITNTINGKRYIGQSIDIDRRFRTHKNSKSHIGLAIKKYGKENFTFEILLNCCKEWMNHWEAHYITKFDSIVPNGYNLTYGGDSNGKKYSEETKKRISENRKGKGIGQIAWNTGLKGTYTNGPHTEETKKKMSENRKGKGVGREVWNKNRPWTEEEKTKMSGWKHSDELKAKWSESRKGKNTGVRSNEWKQAIKDGIAKRNAKKDTI